MTTYLKITALLCALLLALAGCGGDGDKDAAAPAPASNDGVDAVSGVVPLEGKGIKAGVVETQVIEERSTVLEVNYETRHLVLQVDGGGKVEMDVSDSVKNFDQIDKGDVVVVGYLQSVAIAVTAAGEGADVKYASEVAVAAKGEKPGGVVADTMEVTAVVTAIDYDKRTVTLKGPDGSITTLKVSEQATRFKNIEVGDEVHFVYTEAMAVSVEEAGSSEE